MNKICEFCSKEFVGKVKQRFCSRDCFGLSSRNTDDLVGREFNGWTVIEYYGYYRYKNHRTGYHKWVCRCSCGIISTVREQLIIRGGTKQCKSCASSNLSIKNRIYAIPAFLYSAIVNNKRGIFVSKDLSDTYLLGLLEQQEYICALSGVKLVLDFSNKSNTASVDRMDSSVGYIIGNVQWVHKDVNRMKGSLSDSDFVYWCNLISNTMK